MQNVYFSLAHSVISKRGPIWRASVTCWSQRSPARLKTYPASGIPAWSESRRGAPFSSHPGDSVNCVGNRAVQVPVSQRAASYPRWAGHNGSCGSGRYLPKLERSQCGKHNSSLSWVWWGVRRNCSHSKFFCRAVLPSRLAYTSSTGVVLGTAHASVIKTDNVLLMCCVMMRKNQIHHTMSRGDQCLMQHKAGGTDEE